MCVDSIEHKLFGAMLALTVFVLAASTVVSASQAEAFARPKGYVLEFVSTAADGVDINDAGNIIGTSRPDTGCGSDCLPPLDTVVWKNGARIVLPSVPGLTGITVTGINAQGWISGFAGVLFTTTHAVVWKPAGNTYEAIDLGTLPGTTISSATGIDDFGRVVGWSTTNDFPPTGSPFMWTEAGGMVDLSAQGFPDEQPLALSPGGTVATADFWYRLDDSSSVVAMPAAPSGFTLGSEPAAINNAGDQARFLISTGAQHLRYLFRFNHEGTWQQISFVGNGSVIYGIGSITETRDITSTIVGVAQVAYGPDGLAESLAPLVSAAYKGGDITVAGPMNENGQILAKMIIGRSARLVKLVPGQNCTTNCTRVVGLQMMGQGPGFCDQGNDQVKAKLTVKDEIGTLLPNVRITGHFLDDYWLDEKVVIQTNASGQLVVNHVGPACVGAIAFLVTNAETQTGRAFDRTKGVLTNYVIPLP